ncbi:AAA family ATPase [Cellulomonas timonensis]|uniref:AAA family ATPase n=1 Tax=Cellulomonas timonensis TaxID=1689271 RepID=UPI00131A6468|nr:AAA family ATPase [Cellulomonas timonensis]
MTFKSFKQFADVRIPLQSEGLTLVAGGNNAGKSSLLHGLAVWEFCRTVVTMEKGDAAIRVGSHHQGLGLGDDEFSPIALPSLKHLWTNLKTQKTPSDPDGYTLRIRCEWEDELQAGKHLEFGLSLSNDRLFVRATSSNLERADGVPRMAYLPPFAGITDRETRVTRAVRTRRIGEGLAGAVLRNIVLELQEANQVRRTVLRGDRSKISDAALKVLRETDPWELLQQALRQQFSAELIVEPFREEYHSYIRVDLDKGAVDGYKLKRHAGYNRRDLMVEGSGFLQWLSVYALAASGEVDVLLLDEPDAHLHPTLQSQLLAAVAELARKTSKQVLVATHSAEILKAADPSAILEIRPGGIHAKYLAQDHQKVGLLAGIGSSYAPRIDHLRRTKRLLFLEGSSDESILAATAKSLGRRFPDEVTIWQTSASHKERRQLFRALLEEIPGIRALSLRDRDEALVATTSLDLSDKSESPSPEFRALKWRRRHIECYLLHPQVIARVAHVSINDVSDWLASEFGLAISATYVESDCPSAFVDVDGKFVLRSAMSRFACSTKSMPITVAKAMSADEVCVDLRTMLDIVDEFVASA